MQKRLRTRSVGGTLALGEMITELLPAPKLVVLRGDLGAGKTTLVKGMAAALGIGRLTVSSPNRLGQKRRRSMRRFSELVL